MQRILKILVSAGLFSTAASVPLALADEQEINNVSWELKNNEGGQTTCVAENYNQFPVDAVFELFPAAFDGDGAPMPTRKIVTMQPGVEYNVFSWTNASAPSGGPGPTPGPHCALRFYTVRIP
jgi:hypothetical protein